jgi:hypothetical protein
MKSLLFFLLATNIGICHARAELPTKFKQTTYLDCISLDDLTTRLRVIGEYRANTGEADFISVISDSKSIITDNVLTHRYSATEETYEGASLVLVLKRNTESPIDAYLGSQSVRLPSDHFSCVQLR